MLMNMTISELLMMALLVFAVIGFLVGLIIKDTEWIWRCGLAIIIFMICLVVIFPQVKHTNQVRDQHQITQRQLRLQITELDRKLDHQPPLTKSYEQTLRKITQLQEEQIKLAGD